MNTTELVVEIRPEKIQAIPAYLSYFSSIISLWFTSRPAREK